MQRWTVKKLFERLNAKLTLIDNICYTENSYHI